jgi:hypothetical protein
LRAHGCFPTSLANLAGCSALKYLWIQPSNQLITQWWRHDTAHLHLSFRISWIPEYREFVARCIARVLCLFQPAGLLLSLWSGQIGQPGA